MPLFGIGKINSGHISGMRYISLAKRADFNPSGVLTLTYLALTFFDPMKKYLLPSLLAGFGLLWAFSAQSQDLPAQADGDFSFGDISPAAFEMTRYAKDSTADAVVLAEFGRTEIDNSQHNILVHFRHVRIKILNERGIGEATFEIPLYRSWSGDGTEEIYNVKASTFNRVGSETQQQDLRIKDVFTENRSRTMSLAKFTLPGVRAGSVIDVEYNLSSPFIRNFRDWEFQSDIPKVYSEYWAKIPANLDYNVSLTGYLKLDENKREVVRDCLVDFNGGKADCTLMKLSMRDIPAFKDEQFMTARSNYLSAVHFELKEVQGFDGSDRKIANTWESLERQLDIDKDFGVQLKRGPSFFKGLVKQLSAGDTTDLEKARSVYRFFQHTYKWDGYTGLFCEQGIKKMLDAHSGNTGDINLSLVAALRAAGFSADPVLISTRDNGIPHDLFPSVTDFNYVLARVTVGGKDYLLDATHDDLPFGVFPLACVNGRGRVLYDGKPSAWIPLDPPANFNEVDIAQLVIDTTGGVTGTITRTYQGYAALERRKDIARFNSKDQYLDHLNAGQWAGLKITTDSVLHLDDPEAPLIETSAVTDTASGDTRLSFRPFIGGYIKENPFESEERHFPVDFGATEQIYTVLTISYPQPYRLVSLPRQVNLGLPDGGGQYVVQIDSLAHMLVVKTLMKQSKPAYMADEYPVLRRFYGLIIQSQQADVVFSKN